MCIRDRGYTACSKNGRKIEQPIIVQSEIGYLGIICKKINGVLNFLMQAKVEMCIRDRLSYLVTIKKLKKNVFRLSLLGGSIVCMMGYFICVAISRPVLEILFPQWVDEAMRYVPMTTLGVSIYALCIVLTPFVLKCCSIYWQIIINGAGLIVFVSLSYFLSKVYGLMGFCIGVTCS